MLNGGEKTSTIRIKQNQKGSSQTFKEEEG
jgi:hypothetical protein